MDYTNRTILIVEDEDTLLSAFETGFRARGFKVLTATNGVDGLELIKSARPDVVLMDLMMPEMSGEEVLEEMSKQGLSKEVPVIILSNKSDGASLYNCKQLGVKDYLIKVNVGIDDILESIDKIFSEKEE